MLNIIQTPLIEWAKRYGVEDHELLQHADLLESDQIIAGGAVRDFLQRKPIRSDIDLFRVERKGQLGQDDKSWIEETIKQFNGTDEFTTRNFTGFTVGERKFQIITLADYYSVEEVFDSFDFTICQCAVSASTLYVTLDSLYAIGQNRLAVHKITHGIASMRRLLKYASYGFKPCDGTLRDLINMPEPAKASEVTYVD